MPTKPQPAPTPKPRTRRKPAKPVETCPVLAGFARLKQIEASAPAPPPFIDETNPAATETQPVPPRAQPASPRFWLRSLLIFALGVGLGTVVEFPSRNLGRQTIRRYARECDAQACQALRQANDGDMTGEEAARILERVRPTIQRDTWKDAAERFTALQDDNGKIDQAAAAALIDELSHGFRSIH